MSEYVEGMCLGHVACPKHGSSDSLALYEKEINGKKVIDGYCWSECGKIETSELIELGVIDSDCNILVEFATKSSGKVFVMTDEVMKRVNEVLEYETHGWKERRIPRIVSEFYGVKTKLNSEGEVTYRYYPSTENGELVGWHVRNDMAKREKNEKGKTSQQPFFPIGKVRSDCELFGQSNYAKGGKYLILASGEEDAQAIATAMNTEKVAGKLQFKKYITPVVSTTVGEAALKQIKNNYDYITSFENVVIMYDNDNAGKEGAKKIARILNAGQAKIATYTRKDACEHSKNGEFQSIVKAFWEAEQYSPVDVLHMSELWSDFESGDSNVKIPFPTAWSSLNELMGGGMERGEITVIGALTSIGKSSMINSITYHLVENTEFKVGAMFLEGTRREVVRDLLSLDMGMNLRHADHSRLDKESLKQRWFNNFVKPDKMIYVDHQGSLTNDKIFEKLNYLAKVEECDVIILDPIQACVNTSENGAVIEFMDTILKFAKESDTCIILVSHMRKPSGDDPHDVSEYHLMGSSSINQIAFNTILLSRDKMHSSPLVRNSTRLQLVKCRRTGNTQEAGWLRYDMNTTHFHASFNPYEQPDEIDTSGIDKDSKIMDNDLTDDDFDKIADSLDDFDRDWETVVNK